MQARVVNLTELQPDLTIPRLKEALIDAMELVYGHKADVWPEAAIDSKQVEAYRERYASDTFRLGRNIPFTWELNHRFSWGDIQLQCEANGGKIQQLEVYSDAMDASLAESLKAVLKGCAFGSKAMAERLAPLAEQQEIADLAAYLLEQNI